MDRWRASTAAAKFAKAQEEIRDNLARRLSTPQGLARALFARRTASERRRMYGWARQRVARRGLCGTPVSAEASRTQARSRGSGRPAASSSSRRSSAKSGDSGSDGSSESEPPGVAGRHCQNCGRDISHRRADARSCEQAACTAKALQRRRERVARIAPDEAVAARAIARTTVQLSAMATGPCPHLGAALNPEVLELERRLKGEEAAAELAAQASGPCGAHVISKDPEGGRWCAKCWPAAWAADLAQRLPAPSTASCVTTARSSRIAT